MSDHTIRETAHGTWEFMCPGCKTTHEINQGWKFDRDMVRPTITPSVKVSGVAGEVGAPRDTVCHSFVTAGQIQFLSDCTHTLAGTTHPLPPISS